MNADYLLEYRRLVGLDFINSFFNVRLMNELRASFAFLSSLYFRNVVFFFRNSPMSLL